MVTSQSFLLTYCIVNLKRKHSLLSFQLTPGSSCGDQKSCWVSSVSPHLTIIIVVVTSSGSSSVCTQTCTWRSENNFLPELLLSIHHGFQELNLSPQDYIGSTFTHQALLGPSILFFQMKSFPKHVGLPFQLDYLTCRF